MPNVGKFAFKLGKAPSHRRSGTSYTNTMSCPPIMFPPPGPLPPPKRGDVPRLSPSSSSFDAPDSHTSLMTRMSMYHHRGSVLSVAPSIISNAPSTASGSPSDAPFDSTQRRTKLERLRRKLGEEVPATAVFPTTPRTALPRTPSTSTSTSTPKRSPADAHAPAHVVPPNQTIRARSRSRSAPTKAYIRSLYTTRLSKGSTPTRPTHPTHPRTPHVIITRACDDDTAGLVRPRQKMAAGSKIGGSDFKAAMRAKREGRMAEPGEMVEMVGFFW
ncbi:hypothetical protein OG21DRAFT_1500721 [Imleria badia]|nr:hypothetical protein OG21DRAFT_1500721 [Imleria badia]